MLALIVLLISCAVSVLCLESLGDPCSLSKSNIVKLIHEEIKPLKKENEILREQMKEMSSKIQRLKQFIRTSVNGEDNHLAKRLLLLQATNITATPATSPPQDTVPAFTAELSNHLFYLGHHQTIVFDNVISDHGNDYSPQTGVFTAPSNGTYVFFGSILSHQSATIETAIVVNGITVSSQLASSLNTYDQGSNLAVVRLKTGDKVWMHKINDAGTKIYGYNWSSFSGFRISQ